MQVIKAHGGVKVWAHSCLTWAADEGEWGASFLSHLTTNGYWWQSLNGRLFELQRRSGAFGGEKRRFSLSGFEHPALQPLA